jgi:predicted alpha/beta superfamily hydrolase
MTEEEKQKCPVKPGLIIRGKDGHVYQITNEQLQQFRVTRKDEHMQNVERLLSSLDPEQSNTVCLHGDFENLSHGNCCLAAVSQIKDVLKKD